MGFSPIKTFFNHILIINLRITPIILYYIYIKNKTGRSAMKHVIKAFLSSTIFLLSATFSFGQAEIDSTYQEVINRSMAEINAAENGDSLQNEYARQHFNYFLEHPESPTGRRAVSSAFMMWGRTGNVKMVENAISKLDNDSVIWSYIINSIGNAYSRKEKQEEFVELLEQKKDELTDERSKSAAIVSLIYHYKYMQGEDDKELILDLSRQLIDLNANEYSVNFGKGVIYELESLNVGQPAPDFSAITHNGEEIALSDYEGIIVLLEFWATWCGPCIPEIPTFKNLQSIHSSEDLVILGIAVEEKNEDFSEFLEEKEMTWPQINQDKRWDGEVVTLYNVQSIPHTYIIDRDGTIAAKGLRGEELKEQIAGLISEE